MNTNRLEQQLAALIAEHAQWIDGPTWAEVTQRIGAAYFDDAPELVDVDALLTALAAAPLPSLNPARVK